MVLTVATTGQLDERWIKEARINEMKEELMKGLKRRRRKTHNGAIQWYETVS